MEPLVDILVPTFNHEKFIATAIKGLLSQKTEFRFRILIGEDCSTDRTRTIVRQFHANNISLIKPFFHKKNKGVQNKNGNGIFLLRQATAKYIAICDGDDIWIHEDKLQKQIEFLDANPKVAGCFHNSVVIDEDGTVIKEEFVTHPLKIYNQRDCLTRLGSSYSTSSLVFRGRAIKIMPKWYLKSVSDFSLDLLLTEYGELAYLDETLSAYRIHSGGIWQGSPPVKNHEEMLKRLLAIYAYNDKFKRLYGDFLRTKILEYARLISKHYREVDTAIHRKRHDTFVRSGPETRPL
jgi:glycosyltransferase involved in cell wall biosynthesis